MNNKQKLIDSQKGYLHTANDVRERLIKFLDELKTIPGLKITQETITNDYTHLSYRYVTMSSDYKEATYLLYHTHINMTTRRRLTPNLNENAYWIEEESRIYTYEDPLLIGVLLYPFEDLMIRKHYDEMAMGKKA